jgi:hypothetical protein
MYNNLCNQQVTKLINSFSWLKVGTSETIRTQKILFSTINGDIKNHWIKIFTEEKLKNFPKVLQDNNVYCFTYQSSGDKVINFLSNGFPNSKFIRNNGNVDLDEIITLKPKFLIHIITEKFFS